MVARIDSLVAATFFHIFWRSNSSSLFLSSRGNFVPKKGLYNLCLKLQRHQAKKETLFIAFYVDDYTHCSKSSASTLFSISLPFGFVSAYFFVDVWSLHCINVTFEHCQVLGEFLGLRIAKRNLEKQEKQPLLLRRNTATANQLDYCLDTSSTVNTFVLKCIYLIPSTPTIKPRLT